MADAIARLVISDGLPASSAPQAHSQRNMLAEAHTSIQAMVAEASRPPAQRPPRAQITRQNQRASVLALLSSTIEAAIASLQPPNLASKSANDLWAMLEHAQGELDIVVNTLQPLQDTVEKERVVEEMRRLEGLLKEFTANLPKDKRPLYYDSGMYFRSSWDD